MKSQTGRVIADGEYWIALQRLWSFDEPRWRWSRLVKNCERLLGRGTARGVSGVQEVNQLIDVYGWRPVDQPGRYSGTAAPQLGTHRRTPDREADTESDSGMKHDESVNRLASMIFALADVGRFHAIALNLQSTARLAESGWSMLPLSCKTLIEELIRERGLAIDEKQYLFFYALVCPDWLRLIKPGPWDSDPRAKFVVKFLHSILNNPQLFDAGGQLSYSRFSDAERLFYQQMKGERIDLPPSFMPEHIVIVEGATEQILFPRFAELMGLGWQERAISVLAAGGANQVYKRYASLKASIVLAMDCVLDGDVGVQAREIKAILRANDRLHILDKPAIEETFGREQITTFCNQYFQASMQASIHLPVSLVDLEGQSNQECLERLWRKRTHASFDKIGFARTVAENLHDPEEIPAPIRRIMNQISVADLNPSPNPGSDSSGNEAF